MVTAVLHYLIVVSQLGALYRPTRHLSAPPRNIAAYKSSLQPPSLVSPNPSSVSHSTEHRGIQVQFTTPSLVSPNPSSVSPSTEHRGIQVQFTTPFPCISQPFFCQPLHGTSRHASLIYNPLPLYHLTILLPCPQGTPWHTGHNAIPSLDTYTYTFL